MTIYRNIDAWDVREWSRVISKNTELQQSEQRINQHTDDGGAILHDVYFGLYKADPQEREDPDLPIQHRWIKDTMKALHDTSEWRELRERCRLNPIDAETATSELVRTLEPLIPKIAPPKNQPQDPNPASQFLNMLGGDGGGGQTDGSQMDKDKLRRTIRKAVRETIQEMDAMDDAMYGMGWGSGDGADGMTSGADKLKLAQQLRSNPKLKKIAELAGKFRRIAMQTQKSKPRRGVEEIHSVTLGDDISRLVPAELMNFLHPLRKLDMLRRMAEKQLVQYALRGRVREAKGPIVFCIDNSASMAGQREIWAKACMLALANIAREQKRPLVVIHFDTMVRRIDNFPAGGYEFANLVESALFFSGGGTSFTEPLNQAITQVEALDDKADIIFITDDDCGLGTSFINEFNEWKVEHDTQCIGIPVCGAGERTLSKFCDQVEPVFNMTDNSQAMTTMFGV